MKILIIPDVHGKTAWKKALKTHPHDLVIFLGDYVDAALEVTDQQIKENLKEIIALKNHHPSSVILLLGNHDIHYMYYPDNPCSGFRETMQPALTKIYNQFRTAFQIAWHIDDFLFTHAGISEDWYRKYQSYFTHAFPLSEQLNAIHQTKEKSILFEVGVIRGGNRQNNQHSGPLWADKSETMRSMLPGFHQIVGHSKVEKITRRYWQEDPGANTSITYCDCLDVREEYLVLEV